METWKHLFFGGLPGAEDRLYAGLDLAGVSVPVWWTVGSMASDVRQASPEELENVRRQARTIFVPLHRIEQARRLGMSSLDPEEFTGLPEAPRAFLVPVIEAMQEYLKREQFGARHLRHFPLFAVTLLSLRRHGTTREVQLLDVWLQEALETLAPLNALFETDEVRKILGA
jgi:hypothetical protein